MHAEATGSLELTVEPWVARGRRRQATAEVEEIAWALAQVELSQHGFGVRTRFVKRGRRARVSRLDGLVLSRAPR
jgi:hypothetical protein